MFDDIDKQILTALQENARVSITEIGKQIGMVPSGVKERIRKLEEKRIIATYETRLNAIALGLDQVAFVMVCSNETADYTLLEKNLSAIPEVLEVHHVAGQDCYLLKVRTADTEALSDLLQMKIARLKGVSSMRTTIVLKTLKESSILPNTD